MTEHDRALASLAGHGRFLPGTKAGIAHWLAETVFSDAPLGSIGMNAQLSRLAENIEDRRARIAIEGGTCARRAKLPDGMRRHRRRAW